MLRTKTPNKTVIVHYPRELCSSFPDRCLLIFIVITGCCCCRCYCMRHHHCYYHFHGSLQSHQCRSIRFLLHALASEIQQKMNLAEASRAGDAQKGLNPRRRFGPRLSRMSYQLNWIDCCHSPGRGAFVKENRCIYVHVTK